MCLFVFGLREWKSRVRFRHVDDADDGGDDVVVVLMQGGCDSKDRQLMVDKIEFMARIADHENIVKFIASCNDSDEGRLYKVYLWLRDPSSSVHLLILAFCVWKMLLQKVR